MKVFNLSPRPAILKNGYRETITVIIICMAQILNQAGVSQVLGTMNIIADSFSDASTGDKSWFMASFPLVSGTFILISGRLGDIFGLKKVFVIGYIWLSIWSLIAGFTVYTDSTVFFIFCRAMQGLGFACLLPCGMGILGLIYPHGTRKDLVFGMFGACAPTGATLGAIMSSLVGQLAWWPWAFWLTTIVSTLLTALTIIIVPDVSASDNLVPSSTTSWDEKLPESSNNSETAPSIPATESKFRQMDWMGSTIGATGLIFFNFSWNQAPIDGWDKPVIIVLLVLGVLLIVAFFVYELRFAKNPLLPKQIFNLNIGIVLLIVSFGWGSFGVWSYYYWAFSLNLRHYTPIQASLYYLPLLVMGIVAALTVSYSISRTRPSYLLFCASAAFMSGCIMLSVTPIHQTYWRMIFGQMFLLCWGMDLSFPAASLLLSDFLPPHHQGMAGSLVSTMVSYSMSLGLGISGSAQEKVFVRTNDLLKSYRAALYVGIGLAACAVMLSIVFNFTYKVATQNKQEEPSVENSH